MNRAARRAIINAKTKCTFCNKRILLVAELYAFENGSKMHKECALRYIAMMRAAKRVADMEKERGSSV